MSNEPLETEQWLTEVVDLMLSERLPFLAASTILFPERTLSPTDAAAIQRRTSFRNLLAAATRRYYAERGSPADTDKTVLVGSMMDDAKRLRDAGKPKEASEVVASAAKILGYVGADTNVNLFGEVSHADLQRKLSEVRAKRAAEPSRSN